MRPRHRVISIIASSPQSLAAVPGEARAEADHVPRIGGADAQEEAVERERLAHRPERDRLSHQPGHDAERATLLCALSGARPACCAPPMPSVGAALAAATRR